MTQKTLIISDCHIGDQRFSGYEQLTDILLNEPYDRLILNGDIVEYFVGSIKDPLKAEFFDLLGRLSKVKEVIYLFGNHDYRISKHMAALLPHILVAEFFEFVSGGKRFLVTHGHQVYARQDRSLFLKLLAKLNYIIWQHFGIDLQRINDSSEYYLKYVNNKRLKLLRKYGAGFDVVISSHTHALGHCIVGEKELYDIGGFIKTHSFAIVDETGNVRIEVKI